MAGVAEPGSPFNKVTGTGFHRVPTPADLTEIERAYTTHDAPIHIELAHPQAARQP